MLAPLCTLGGLGGAQGGEGTDLTTMMAGGGGGAKAAEVGVAQAKGLDSMVQVVGVEAAMST